MSDSLGPTRMSFEQWVAYVFTQRNRSGHPTDEPEPYDPEADPAEALAYLHRLFANPEVLLAFTDEQIGAGLKTLVDATQDDHIFVLRDPKLPLAERQATIRAIANVYERVFAVRLRSGQERSPLADICFMWFDEMPLSVQTDGVELGEAIFDALRHILAIENEACQYAALHGLSENYHGAGRRYIHKLVDDFLGRHPNLPKDLREYALAAQIGNVQ